VIIGGIKHRVFGNWAIIEDQLEKDAEEKNEKKPLKNLETGAKDGNNNI
tara:strand:- start:818 stop:964 length:147 start_codon:yes stop_codon:yes gene_type:complete